MIVDFFIKKEIENKGGYFCGVKMDVESTNEPGLRIVSPIDSEWSPYIVFAINYFYESYRLSNKMGGLKVNLLELNTHAIDTCGIAVTYAIIGALLKAFKMETNSLGIDDSGNLVLPKRVFW